jgi:HEAT repeat protein/cytochrome c-type biogenesis protein CcmH/NrfG
LQVCGDDSALRREARRRVVRLWAATGELPRRIAEFERTFMFSPVAGSRPAEQADPRKPDIDAGRFLAEAYRALATGRRRGQGDARQFEAADRVLEHLLELVPGDLESLQALERSRVLRGDLAGALKVLGRLLEADPKNAQSYLGRMAEHSLALYRDDDAIHYAERLLALRPNDAQAHARLGDLYRARQDIAHAIASYERALVLDATEFEVSLKLAEIYVSTAQPQKADPVLREALRKSTDDELVKRAASMLLQLNRGTQELAVLEQFMLPLALARPQRPVYRRALVELYDALIRPSAAGTRDSHLRSTDASAEQTALAQRASKPLLEALADTDTSQRRIAVELLGQMGNAYAAVALLTTAEHDGDIVLRRLALLGAAAAAPETLAGRFQVLARAPERRLRDAAAYGLARMSGSTARAALHELLQSPTPSVRALSLMGQSRSCDAASMPVMRSLLATDPSALVRGAAALALGLCRDRTSVTAIAAALRSERDEAALAAAVALGLLGDRTAAESLTEVLFAADPALRTAASWSLRRLAREARPEPPAPTLGAPDEPLSLGPWLGLWMAREPEVATSEMFTTFSGALYASAQAALVGSRTSARTALALLGGEDPAVSPGPAACRALRDALQPELRELSGHADPQVRAAALLLLAGGGAADASFVAALDDDDTLVQSAALDAIRSGGPIDSAQALERLSGLATHDPRWWVRRRAVLALTEAGAAGVPILVRVLGQDEYAYVREAAANGLGELREPSAWEALTRAAAGDSEIRVRQAAADAIARLVKHAPAASGAPKAPD